MSIDNALFGRMQLQHLAINNLIQWGDHMSVDHPVIDAQHKAIFDLGTGIYEKWRKGGKSPEMRPTIDKLAKFFEAHFAFEEDLLKQINYEGLSLHQAEHRVMLDEVRSLRERMHSVVDGRQAPGGSVLAPGWPVMNFVLGFTVGHVASSDMAYCRPLAAHRKPS